MPFLPSAPIRIQPYFGYRNRERLRISARALRAQPGDFTRGRRARALRTMLSQFLSHEVAELPVELEIARPGGVSHRHQGLTDREGFVHFDIRLDPEWAFEEITAWESVLFRWTNVEGPQKTEGHVLGPGTSTGLGVISDIDDTIVETGITGNFRAVLRNWRRVLLEMPEERMLVPEADLFYGALSGGLPRPKAHAAGTRLPAASRPFFYVSSSPWNLFSYLVAFLRGRGLPLGPILLRDWGFDRATFGGASHGAHKRAAIDAILASYPELKFILVGDDSQGDLTVFGEVAVDYPGRVRAIFIRTTGPEHSAEETLARKAIEQAGVPLWLGEGYDTGHEFLASVGLLADEEATRVVETAARPAKSKDDLSLPVQGKSA